MIRVSAAGGGARPTKKGWHLIRFSNGDAAVVRWTGSKWAWGSVKHPAMSSVIGWDYLAPTIYDLVHHGGQVQWDKAMGKTSARQGGILVSLLDHGSLLKGQPVLVTRAGHTHQNIRGSEAVAINQIPSPIPPNASLPGLGGLGSLGLGSLGLRVLEAIGAILLLVIGLRVLIGGDSATVQIARAARKVAR